jgi:hypothetical protein
MENMAKSIALVARDMPSTDVLDDLRTFAWEILRRRADFCGTPTTVKQIGTRQAPIEFIMPLRPSSERALRFRRDT